LSRFDFILKYISESKMEKVDSLSRRPDWEFGVEKNNEKQMLVKKKWLKAKRIKVAEVDLLDRVRKCEVRDGVVKTVEEMKQAEVKILRDKKWQQEDKLILKEGKLYISRDKKLRVEVIRLYYNTPIEEHGGQWKTAKLVTRNFW